MAVIAKTSDGLKLVQVEATLTNSGTAVADVSVNVTVEELGRVEHVLSAIREDKNNSGVYVGSVRGNVVPVTAQSVPAGESTKVLLTVAGY